MNKDIYVNDLLHRFSGYSFVETTIQSMTKVEFQDGGSATVAEATNLVLVDAYMIIRSDMLEASPAAFLSSETERDALSDLDTGTQIYNLTASRNETYDGSKWVAAGGETGGLVHISPTTVTTTDNTEMTICTVTLVEGAAYLFTAEVLGETSDLAIVIGEIIEVTAKRTPGGSAEIVGSVSTVHSGKDAGAASWGVGFTVSGNDLMVSVTGGNAVTVDWECDLNYLEF